MRRYNKQQVGLTSIVGLFFMGLYFTPPASAEIEMFEEGSAANAVGVGVKRKEKCAVPPTWGGVISGRRRFVATFQGAAYCDRQTGLVWETLPDIRPWSHANALIGCLNRTVGGNGQKGWRLPSISELASLVDTASTLCSEGGPCLPDGNPFKGVVPGVYWSATGSTISNGIWWSVDFSNGDVMDEGIPDSQVWCVRGAMSADMY